MNKEIFEGFYKKFSVKTRQGRGGVYPYVSADDITDRMNRLFKGNWSSMVTYQDVIGDEIVIRVRVEVADADTNSVYFHEGFGGHKINPTDEPGNGFKSAYSKALVNACRRWGVGLFLAEDEENKNMGGESGPKPNVPTQPQPKSDALPSTPKSEPEAVSAETTVTQEEPKNNLPKISVPGGNVRIPKFKSNMDSPPPEIAPDVVKTTKSMPKIPIQSPPPVQTRPETIAPATAVEDDVISDVQVLAINSLVDTKGFKYEDLAMHVMGEVKDVNTLKHDEAIAIIQYGNKLYRENKQK